MQVCRHGICYTKTEHGREECGRIVLPGGIALALSCCVGVALDFVTPLKKRRLARESLSVDGSLRSISEEEDSPSERIASPPDAMPPTDTLSAIDNCTSEVILTVTMLVFSQQLPPDIIIHQFT